MIPDWLRAEIVTGLQKLFVLRLSGTPPEDAIGGVGQVWLEAMDRPGIDWDEQLDLDRVQQAFRVLFRTCERWPVPKQLVDCMGNRDPPRALPPPPMTKAQMDINRARVRELAETLARKKTIRDKGHLK